MWKFQSRLCMSVIASNILLQHIGKSGKLEIFDNCKRAEWNAPEDAIL